jgi:hypothetical protein
LRQQLEKLLRQQLEKLLRQQLETRLWRRVESWEQTGQQQLRVVWTE